MEVLTKSQLQIAKENKIEMKQMESDTAWAKFYYNVASATRSPIRRMIISRSPSPVAIAAPSPPLPWSNVEEEWIQNLEQQHAKENTPPGPSSYTNPTPQQWTAPTMQEDRNFYASTTATTGTSSSPVAVEAKMSPNSDHAYVEHLTALIEELQKLLQQHSRFVMNKDSYNIVSVTVSKLTHHITLEPTKH